MYWKSPLIVLPLILVCGFLVLVGLAVLYLVFGVAMSVAIRDTDFFPFERAIPAAFEALRTGSESDRFDFVCRGFDCDEVLPHLGPVTSATCKSYMAPWGACCIVSFTRGDGSEVHIYWHGPGKYKLTLTPPMCRDPEFESSMGTEAADGPRWIHCNELPEEMDSGPRVPGRGGRLNGIGSSGA